MNQDEYNCNIKSLDETIKEHKKLIKKFERHIRFGKVFCILSVPYLLSFVVFGGSERIRRIALLMFIFNTFTTTKVAIGSKRLSELKEYTYEIIEEQKRKERLSIYEGKIKKSNIK